MRKIRFLLLIFLLIVGFYTAFKIFSLVSYYEKKGRINILFYDSSPVFLSLDLKTGVNYYLVLPLDLKIKVPGGYGEYRIGSVGKLAYLEKEPKILERSFSFFIGSFIDYYFYPSLSSIFYTADKKIFLRKKEVLIYKSNAGFLKKLYLFFKIFPLNSSSFVSIKIKPEEVKEDTINFLKFNSRIQGNFYLPQVREENKKIKIFYSKNYKSAENLAFILKGEGFDVLDFASYKGFSKCKIKFKVQSFSVEYLNKILGCEVKFDDRVGDNIIELYLSEKEEEEWK